MKELTERHLHTASKRWEMPAKQTWSLLAQGLPAWEHRLSFPLTERRCLLGLPASSECARCSWKDLLDKTVGLFSSTVFKCFLQWVRMALCRWEAEMVSDIGGPEHSAIRSGSTLQSSFSLSFVSHTFRPHLDHHCTICLHHRKISVSWGPYQPEKMIEYEYKAVCSLC